MIFKIKQDYLGEIYQENLKLSSKSITNSLEEENISKELFLEENIDDFKKSFAKITQQRRGNSLSSKI